MMRWRMPKVPGINSEAADRLYSWLVLREAKWKAKHGLKTRVFTYEVPDLDHDDRVVYREEVVVPHHWLYGRLMRVMYWLGYTPF